jgi:hypothetical protein
VLAPQGIGVQVPSSAPIHILTSHSGSIGNGWPFDFVPVTESRQQTNHYKPIAPQPSHFDRCDRLIFSPAHATATLYEGRSSMKTEKYLLLVLVVFALIILGTFLHKVIH